MLVSKSSSKKSDKPLSKFFVVSSMIVVMSCYFIGGLHSQERMKEQKMKTQIVSQVKQ